MRRRLGARSRWRSLVWSFQQGGATSRDLDGESCQWGLEFPLGGGVFLRRRLMRKRLWGVLAAAALSGTAGAAAAADLSVARPAPPAPPILAYNWTGAYLGVQGGFDWDSAFTPPNHAANERNRGRIRRLQLAVKHQLCLRYPRSPRCISFHLSWHRSPPSFLPLLSVAAHGPTKPQPPTATGTASLPHPTARGSRRRVRRRHLHLRRLRCLWGSVGRVLALAVASLPSSVQP